MLVSFMVKGEPCLVLLWMNVCGGLRLLLVFCNASLAPLLRGVCHHHHGPRLGDPQGYVLVGGVSKAGLVAEARGHLRPTSSYQIVALVHHHGRKLIPAVSASELLLRLRVGHNSGSLAHDIVRGATLACHIEVRRVGIPHVSPFKNAVSINFCRLGCSLLRGRL